MRRTALLVLIFSFMVALCLGCNSSKRAAGDHVIAQVEKFKQQHGKLPDTLEDMGIKADESGPIYYEKKSDSHYIVWYGTSLGESATYDSEVRRSLLLVIGRVENK